MVIDGPGRNQPALLPRFDGLVVTSMINRNRAAVMRSRVSENRDTLKKHYKYGTESYCTTKHMIN